MKGWCCSDCAMFIANGDTPVEMNEEETEKWIDNFISRNDNHLFLGDDHDEFSWSPCDTCGSNLGGSRYEVGVI